MFLETKNKFKIVFSQFKSVQPKNRIIPKNFPAKIRSSFLKQFLRRRSLHRPYSRNTIQEKRRACKISTAPFLFSTMMQSRPALCKGNTEYTRDCELLKRGRFEAVLCLYALWQEVVRYVTFFTDRRFFANMFNAALLWRANGDFGREKVLFRNYKKN